MFITRKHPIAGRALGDKMFPLAEDPRTGHTGFKVGYLETGEPVLITRHDMGLIVSQFYHTMEEYEKAINKFNTKRTIKEIIIKRLGGKIDEKLTEEYT